jgi:hypothetical protein
MMILSALLFVALTEALPSTGGQWLEKRQGGQSTMLRFGCSQVVIDRIDPLVNPGVAPSPHMHQGMRSDDE